jgi:hypothetical protein
VSDHDDETVMVTREDLAALLAHDRAVAEIDEAPTSPGEVFDLEAHVNHARICPSCSRLLQRCDTGWTCEQPGCLKLTDAELEALLGRPLSPRTTP